MDFELKLYTGVLSSVTHFTSLMTAEAARTPYFEIRLSPPIQEEAKPLKTRFSSCTVFVIFLFLFLLFFVLFFVLFSFAIFRAEWS